ncbi:MAG: SDR family oxidoreductase [Gammaproteobacteria bacterium]|nr:SDR family oxidoreductase [Gammaproteobacteria bacterium]
MDQRALVQGASRGIGLAFVKELRRRNPDGTVFATCREPAAAAELTGLADSDTGIRPVQLDATDDRSVRRAAESIAAGTERLDLLINVAGLLHEGSHLRPERRLSEVDRSALQRVFDLNAFGPLLVARHFEPLLRAGEQPRFAALSARVGSIGDNRLGGWYAYRMSKAALNMGLRTLAIEWARGSRRITTIALHPGTVATDLSAPFRRNGDARRTVFSPETAAGQLLDVLDGIGPDDTGGFFAWDGARIPW